MAVHILEQAADRRARMVGMERGVPFQGGQQFLLYGGIGRMTQRAQAGLVQRFGPAMKSAEQESSRSKRATSLNHSVRPLSSER